jgi:hypothetical protein
MAETPLGDKVVNASPAISISSVPVLHSAVLDLRASTCSITNKEVPPQPQQASAKTAANALLSCHQKVNGSKADVSL